MSEGLRPEGPSVTLTAPSSTSINEDIASKPALPQLTINDEPARASEDNKLASGELSPYSQAPPSPVPSYSSAAPLTSLALRDHDPNKHSRSASLSTQGDATTLVSDTSKPGVPSDRKVTRPDDADVQDTAPVAAKAKSPPKWQFWKKKGAKEENEDKAEGILQSLPDPSDAEMGVFSLKPSQLRALVDPKSVEVLESYGGLEGLEQSLRTSLKDGLPESSKAGDGIPERQKIYLANVLDSRKSKSIFELMWMAFSDKIIILLSVAAVISLALGIYQAVGTDPVIVNGQAEPQVQWVEGVAIIVAITIVVVVGAANDFQKELQFKKLNDQKEDRFIKVIRGGTEKLINVHDLVVGDVCQIEPGEIVPVDGVFISGHNVRCDESSTTGESDAIRKATYSEVLSMHNKAKEHGGKAKADCFILSGSKIVEGNGTYVATCVGKHSILGGIMTSLRRRSGQSDSTPLQIKLNHLAEIIAKLGLSSALLLFVALIIRFLAQLNDDPTRDSAAKAQNFIDILIIAVTVIVVAVPEGLPLAVTLALAFATRRMTKENLLVRVLASCETMANTTVVCTDKTGTLTQNEMSVVAGSVGVHLKFADRLTENKSRANANDDVEGGEKSESTEEKPRRQGRMDFSLDMKEISSAVQGPVRRVFNEAIAINSTAFEGEDEKGRLGFIGSKTETALLAFAKEQGWTDYRQVRDSAAIVQVFPFSSERKCSGVAVKLADGRIRLHVKGASELLERRSTSHVHVANPKSKSFSETDAAVAQREEGDVKTFEFTDETRANVERSIIFYANQSLRTIALCYRDFPSWPPKGVATNESGEVEDFDSINQDLTLLAITAIEDPLRPGVIEAVRECQGAGVQVKMCTGDNVLTARSIATQCGIFTPGGLIMEGPHFRTLSDQELLQVLPRLQILARSSPQDKERLVAFLRAEPLREIVGVTGDGMNDAPALKKANVGFSMGIAGTEVAKEASDIVLMDDNFASIVTAIVWGRCVNDAVRKFLQFQLSVNITAVLITFITAISSSEEESVLTAVQLLWVNLIMDTLAALALATDPATRDMLKRKPDGLSAPLISVNMWKMIIGQSIYQLITALVLHFAGPSIFNVHNDDPATQLENERELATLIFNQFVFCQVFNALNARVLDRRLNVFRNFYKNPYFISIWIIMIAGQTLIVFVGGAAFSVTRIPGTYWAISIIIGLISLPIGVVIRLIPNEPCAWLIVRVEAFFDLIGRAVGAILNPIAYFLHIKKRKPKAPVLPTADPEKVYGVPLIVDNLKVLSTVRGGRTRSSSIVRRSRSKILEKHDIRPVALMGIVPSLVLSSIGTANWRRDDGPGTLSDPSASDPSASSAALWTGMAQIHPDTPADDPMVARYGVQRATEAGLPAPTASARHRRSPSAASQRSSVGTIPEDNVEEEKPEFGDSLKPPGL